MVKKDREILENKKSGVRAEERKEQSEHKNAGKLISTLSFIGIFLNNFVSKYSNPYPDLISVFSLSVRVSTRNIIDC
jgi:hypothetical protein